MSLQADMDRGRWKNLEPRRCPTEEDSGINSAASRVKLTFFWYGCWSVMGVFTDSDEDWDRDRDRDRADDEDKLSSDMANDL